MFENTVTNESQHSTHNPYSILKECIGLNIDVGNSTSQTSSTWFIPNIYVTTLPQNPTNTKMHVSEGPGSTQEISLKANPQSKFP
ncbi:hypothetical protein O181_004899 [Austropuccinia psidii MF-1]|uniref:Uncharacterized protein n=1 Tax=Austropuccinia psidii MF-1 TaxID=1389203 RepID=A0A9Q3BH45_9BASI|nr:hypothetical protein [Austropuccinia psidii MF-1]